MVPEPQGQLAPQAHREILDNQVAKEIRGLLGPLVGLVRPGLSGTRGLLVSMAQMETEGLLAQLGLEVQQGCRVPQEELGSLVTWVRLVLLEILGH